MYYSSRLYHLYCVNFDAALQRLSVWQSFSSGQGTPVTASPNESALRTSVPSAQRRRIRQLLRDAKKDQRHSQIDLQSYLLLPIQRIPRYKMLLESLAECTSDVEDADAGDPTIVEALEIITQLANEMNERKRDSEGRHRLFHWQGRLGARFKSPLVQPHRTLLKEGIMVGEATAGQENMPWS